MIEPRERILEGLPGNWLVVPVCGKRPVGGADWPNKAARVDSIDTLPPTADGLGLLLGPSSGVIDIECDGAAAESRYAHIAGEDAPVCPTWASTRGKHRLFAWDERLGGLPCSVQLGGGLEARLGQNRAQSVLPPAGGRQWLVRPDEVEPPPLPPRLLAAILDAGKPQPSNLRELAAGNGSVAKCLAACRQIGMADVQDGSRRLFAYACRCVEHNLSDADAIRVVRTLERERPFPRAWTDAEILTRLRQAERHVSRIELAPEPLPWQPYPVDALPEPFRAFVQSTAHAMGCDASYVALPLMVAAAAAIGTTRRLEVKAGWQAPPIVWGVLVGESGTLKTPALRAALQWTERRQVELLAAHDEARKQFEADWLAYEKAFAEWKRAKTAGLPPVKPEAPAAVRVLIQDTTVEAVVPILKANPRGVLLARDELAAWLSGFDRYANVAGGDVAFWLSAYNALPVTVDRKLTGTLHVPVVAVSVCGGIQPGVLQRALGLINRENGLAARLLLVMPPRRPKRWTEASIEPAIIDAVGAVFNRLFGLEHDYDGKPVPRTMRLSVEAKAAYIDFYNAHANQLADATGDWAAALSKLEELPLRLGLVLHLVRWAAGESVDADIVDGDSMGRAIALTEWHKHETRRVYDIVLPPDEGADDKGEESLLAWIRGKGGVVTVRDLTHGLRRYRGKSDEAEAALNGLAQAGLGSWEDSPSNKKGGRPTRVFRLCPQCHRHQNPKNPRDSEGFGDGANGDTLKTNSPEPEPVNLIPPESWDVAAVNRLLDEAAWENGATGA
ncbi:DUF3987 domain-containing protein [Thermogutta sp.]|uniref:DUF3987 domain-containing protein n=1 Tax=Thermogutta sp. TaxID=1962930 RepID=UPI00321FD999